MLPLIKLFVLTASNDVCILLNKMSQYTLKYLLVGCVIGGGRFKFSKVRGGDKMGGRIWPKKCLFGTFPAKFLKILPSGQEC